MAEVQLTEAGRKELEERLDYLKSVRRAEIAEEIKTARGFGDLSENAEYDAARKAQAEMEGEIAEIEAKLRNAKIIHETVVTYVEIVNGKEDEPKTFTIVGTSEADFAKGRISDESPIGKTLLEVSNRLLSTKKMSWTAKDSEEDVIVHVQLPNGRTKTMKVLATSK